MVKYLLCLEFEEFYDEKLGKTVDTYLPVKLYDSLEEAMLFIERNLEVNYMNQFGPKRAGKDKGRTSKSRQKEHIEFYKTESDVIIAEFYPIHVIFPMDNSGEFDMDEIVRWNGDQPLTHYIEDFTVQVNKEDGSYIFYPSTYKEEKEEGGEITDAYTIEDLLFTFTTNTNNTVNFGVGPLVDETTELDEQL